MHEHDRLEVGRVPRGKTHGCAARGANHAEGGIQCVRVHIVVRAGGTFDGRASLCVRVTSTR